MTDWLVNKVIKVLKLQEDSYDFVFTVLYNFIPAFFFAPYLIYVGVQYARVLLILIGVTLFLVDLIHFVKAMKKILRKEA